ncbi:hypothetical protein TPHA_0A01990 [Tetrapisispora phaffii CBS 4417]|uniref:PQ loop repeat protein n=1 Tax=Tetrapisispora phaffii (strain ATCC 24235 / CBS 4417 / NBRC 1672 / NRRL Y-8282 / UCD 70-5) TaxID=1071381 RepID=G8BN03_TETPH|nr:hypothetical protein TPHA_0A01990 [Tetrapisispora phaffii CBS 4417]CCE61281.1 hypothetical protein TPHA_0A01990 [Tetrapisispora phaffii CBS 4417]
MVHNAAAATALATVGTVLWCIQLIPQIIYNWKRKDCTGLLPIMMFLWVISGIPFAIYFCIINTNVTLQVQPHLFTFFCGISFIQSCYYPPVQLSKIKIILITAAIIAFAIASEVGFIVWLRPLYAKGTEWPALIFGIIASVLLAIGLLPPYFELAKRQGRVVGINFVFLTLDSLGAYFSIASVAVGDLDILGVVLYAIVAVLELGIFISHFIWCCRFKWFSDGGYVDDEDVIQDHNEVHMVNDHAPDSENEEYECHVVKIKTENEYDKVDLETQRLGEVNKQHSSTHDLEKDDKKEVQQFPYIDENVSMIRAVHGISVQREFSKCDNVYTTLDNDISSDYDRKEKMPND